jgi:hypothetical protein
MSYAMFYAVSAVPNDYGRWAGLRQPDDGWAVGHRLGPVHREGSA